VTADADDVVGDTVIQASRTWYDQAGQTVAAATYKRIKIRGRITGFAASLADRLFAVLVRGRPGPPGAV